MPGARRVRRRRRPVPGFGALLILTIVWLLLVGEVSLWTIGGGFVLSLLIALVFPLPPWAYRGRIHLPALLWLLIVLLKDLAVSSAVLALYSLRRNPVPRSGVVAIRLKSESDLYQVGTATLVSIVPGTIALDARRRSRTLYLHVFDLVHEGNVEREVKAALAVERRLLRAFGSREEIEAAYGEENRP